GIALTGTRRHVGLSVLQPALEKLRRRRFVRLQIGALINCGDETGAFYLCLSFASGLKAVPFALAFSRARVADIDHGIPIALTAFANVPLHDFAPFGFNRRCWPERS